MRNINEVGKQKVLELKESLCETDWSSIKVLFTRPFKVIWRSIKTTWINELIQWPSWIPSGHRKAYWFESCNIFINPEIQESIKNNIQDTINDSSTATSTTKCLSNIYLETYVHLKRIWEKTLPSRHLPAQ